VTTLELAPGESAALADYLDRLTGLDDRAAVRLQSGGGLALGVWSGPPFEVVALRPVALAEPVRVDVTVSARRLRERLSDDGDVELPASVPGPSWVGLLPPRSGWEERARGEVGYLRDAVGLARHFFGLRADGVTDRGELTAIANDVWQRACLGEVPVRAAHAAEALGLLGPADGEAVAYAAGGWLRLRVPGGSVALRRRLPDDALGSLSLLFPDPPR
jgi:hypothetical protein